MIRDFFRRPKPAGTASSGRVSVIIPLYNHQRYIAEAVASVLTQGPVLHELIVIDDGSTDGSAAVMEQLAGTDGRIIFWSQPNRGAHAAINSGLHRATGEFVAILNSDDLFAADRLKMLVSFLDKQPAAELVCSRIECVDQAGAPMRNEWYEEALRFHRSCGDMAVSLINGNILMTTSNFVMRRGVLGQIGNFAPLRYAHDLDYALRLLVLGDHRVALVPEVLLYYRMHDRNTINEAHDRVRLEWATACACFLHRLWDGDGDRAIDWARARMVLEVTDRHHLTPAVQLLMAWLRRHGVEAIDHGMLVSDADFVAQVAQVLR